MRAEQRKQEAVETAAELAVQRLKGERGADVARFLRRFYGHVPPEDIVGRSSDELYGAALSLWRFAESRPSGRAKLRVINPRLEEHGWRSPRTVIEIVNDDMPFLVDSVTSALAAQGVAVHLIIHPILRLERDEGGRIVALCEREAKANGNALRESFMHVEIGEESDPQRLAELAALLERVLGEVRAAVEDWQQMRRRLAAIVADLGTHPPPLDAAERTEALDFLAWLDDDNFTFLGFENTASVETRGGGLESCRAASSASCATTAAPCSTACLSPHPPEVREFLREPRVLMISKSNRARLVHRGAYRTVSIQEFDANGGP